MYLIIGFFFVAILMSSFNLKFVSASDDDNDGIDDDFEEDNKRNIEIEISESEIQIESNLRSGDQIDNIQLKIQYESEGLSIEVSYEEEHDSGSETELEFGVKFQEIIEYIDNDDDGVFNSDLDSIIKTVSLDEFYPVNYSLSSISGNSDLHYFRIETKDGIFRAHIYFMEEFSIVNNSIITPNQMKINIEIFNFSFINENSKLALYIKLESEIEFEEEEVTEDEEKGFAENEEGVITTINQYAGIFTWEENATIDGKSQRVLVSSIETDDHDENEQKIYLNYLSGNKIFHDPKIGIKGLLISKIDSFSLVPIIILISVITVLSISIAYSIYYFNHNRTSPISWDDSKEFLKTPKQISLLIFEEDNSLDKLIQLGDISITTISEDFLEKIDDLELEKGEKEEFLQEMLSLTPEERNSILSKMLKS